jgi:hypothetical protein
MRMRGHLQVLAAATAAWLAFWIAGLPDYYQQYATRALVVLEVVLLPPVWAIGYLVLRRWRGSRLNHALVLSFYFSVPVFLYDLLYCGLHLGHGLGFIVRYWYLTTYYFVPWLLWVPTALWLEANSARSPLGVRAPADFEAGGSGQGGGTVSPQDR